MAIAGVRGRALIAVVGSVALALAAAVVVFERNPPSIALGATSERDAAAAVPAAAPPWTGAQLRDLLDAVKGADAEGLRSADYKLDALQQAVSEGRTGAETDLLADGAAGALAHDYAAGRVRNRHAFNWYIDYAGPDTASLAGLITAAREKGDLQGWLAGLLPTSPQYRALREALATTSGADADRRDRIRANLERWRWLPRDFGHDDQLYVNLPTYQLDVVHAGQTVASYKAVIGATDMPTPVLSSMVRQVIANPDWIVPQSIVRKSHLRPGGSSRYVFSTRPDGTLRVRQKPGAGNALGKVKIEFPNKLAIYFHDTPSRSLFGASARAFSHGCVRVQNIEALAASIVRDQDRLAAALANSKTRGFPIARPMRANIVYLTLVPDADGRLADVGDPYKMDERLAAALDGRKVSAPAPAAAVVANDRPAPTRIQPVARARVTPPEVMPASDAAPVPRPDQADPAANDPQPDAPALGNQD